MIGKQGAWNAVELSSDSESSQGSYCLDSDEDEEYLLHGVGGKQPPWRGAPPPVRQKPPARARVKSGSLDFKSDQRLDTLHRLRMVASAKTDLLAAAESMSLAMVPARADASRHAASRGPLGPTDVERAARREEAKDRQKSKDRFFIENNFVQ